MLVRQTTPLPVECVARGYVSGSGWKDYQATGEVCGIALPAGLRESDRLPTPLFTPATKADSGHDLNITEAEAAAARRRRAARAAQGADAGAVCGSASPTPPVVRHHPRRHQVRVRADRRRRAAAHRRGDDARFVALLAGGITTRPAARSPASTSSTCATTSSRSTGTSSRRCRRCPTRSWRAPREVSGRLSAPDRPRAGDA